MVDYIGPWQQQHYNPQNYLKGTAWKIQHITFAIKGTHLYNFCKKNPKRFVVSEIFICIVMHGLMIKVLVQCNGKGVRVEQIQWMLGAEVSSALGPLESLKDTPAAAVVRGYVERFDRLNF